MRGIMFQYSIFFNRRTTIPVQQHSQDRLSVHKSIYILSKRISGYSSLVTPTTRHSFLRTRGEFWLGKNTIDNPRRSRTGNLTLSRYSSSSTEMSSPSTLVYRLPADTVYPLSSPQEFYETLMNAIDRAENRITLASLYIGTGELEQDLVQKIREQCLKHPKLRVAIQLDLCRALRSQKKPSSSSLSSSSSSNDLSTEPRSAKKPSTKHEQLSQQLNMLQTAVPADAQSSRSSIHAHTEAIPLETHNRMFYSSYASSAQHLLRLYQPLIVSRSVNHSSSSEAFSASSPASDIHTGTDLSSRIRIGLTLMPQLRGILGRYIPPRWIEAGGVFHMKAYLIDNHTIILSGANLSQDYFTNRQDRYIVIRKPSTATQTGENSETDTYQELEKYSNYLHSLIDDIATVPGSHILLPDGKVNIVPVSIPNEKDMEETLFSFGRCISPVSLNDPLPVPQYNSAETPSYLHAIFNKEIYQRLRKRSNKVMNYLAPKESLSTEFPSSASFSSKSVVNKSADTSSTTNDNHSNYVYIYPRIQLGKLQLNDDELQTLNILHNLQDYPRHVCYIATGYFNLPISLIQAIIGDNETKRIRRSEQFRTPNDNNINTSIHIITAAPRANGFFGASGMSGAIPVAYSEIERTFYDECKDKNRLMSRTLPSNENSSSMSVPVKGPGVAIYEYNREGWTFHGKGLWLMDYNGSSLSKDTTFTTNDDAALSIKRILTLVGSPNFGLRSINRDLELQCTFITENPELIQRLSNERDALFGLSSEHNSSSSTSTEITRDKVNQPPSSAVRPIGPHLGKEYDVWASPERQLFGWSWTNGLWIHIGRRILAPFF